VTASSIRRKSAAWTILPEWPAHTSARGPQLVEIETVNEHVDRSHRVFLAHIIVERCREQRALPTINSFNKALHQMPCKIAGNLIARITSNRGFSHSLGHFRTHAPQQIALYSMTSSARASSEGGTVRFSDFAVLRLMLRSNLLGCSIGRSAGLAPRKIRSTYVAPRRNSSLKSVL
jgi:hypothetical protein